MAPIARFAGISPLLLLALTAPPNAHADTVTASTASYFDAPAAGAGDYGVVGSFTPAFESWGKVELLEGHQSFRREAYNGRTEKLRYQDTYQDADYPLKTYFGDLNQLLVDGFNLAYGEPCGQKNSPLSCGDIGPTRPEARYALLLQGPQTAVGACDTSRTPMLLVHGALQDGNVWLYPAGSDGSGEAWGGGDAEGPVHWLEAEGVCTYALTFGNFHGDNISQAIHVANALSRVKALTGRNKVDVAAWSKGVVAVDLYAANIAGWDDWGADYFEAIAAAQGAEVPAYRDDIGTYYALSGPHNGFDLNWRHPYDNLIIPSTEENAPIGRGPLSWSRFSAVQCLTWGWFDSDNPSPIQNPFAVSICENRGAYWDEFFEEIVLTNIEGLDSRGRPTFGSDLRDLNVAQGLPAAGFDFDDYNISVYGSVNDDGVFESAYLGQLQVIRDYRERYPIPCRECDLYDWGAIDTDETGWFDWLELKLIYNPFLWFWPAGSFTDLTHTECRETAYDPEGHPCYVNHLWRLGPNKEGQAGVYSRYKLFDSLGIDAARRMGGDLMNRLSSRGLDPRLDRLVVVYGTQLGEVFFETDGMACPSCSPNSDGVLFQDSIRARDQLTQGWSSADRARSAEWPYALGHLEVGVDPGVWQDILGNGR